MKKWVLIIILSLLILFSTIFTLYCNSKYYIVINGEKNITLNLNEEYKELGAKTLLNSKINIKGSVDTTKVGEYKIDYCHNKNCNTRIVKVIDNISPEITLNGLAEINVPINGQYIELGAKAIDNYDGDITNNIEVENNLDITKEGAYTIKYKIKDNGGNEAEVDRVINVSQNGPLSLSMADFNMNGYFLSTILKETEDKGESYLNDTLFYGDSITFNFFYYGQLPKSSVWAMSNLTPENAHFWDVPYYKYGEEINLISGLEKHKPNRLIITLGANAVAVMTKDFFISEYESLVEEAKKASPDTTIIIQSIFPVDHRFDNSRSLNNIKINNFNYYLAEMCERQNIYFLNTAEVLKDSEGYLKEEYCYPSDGIHLLPNGNIEVMNYVRRHGV